MSSQLSFLDEENRDRGRRAKATGTAKVQANNKEFVDSARKKALEIIDAKGRVTADDLRKYYRRIGVGPKHPNAWGAIFNDKRFKHLGFESSATPSRRAGIIRIWKRSTT